MEAIPSATVVYVPESQVLYFENGKIREEAEEMARQVVVYYSKEDESDPVAVRIDSAEVVLKTFVDAILAKQGITPDPNAPKQRHKKGYRETAVDQIRQAKLELAPYSEATYDPDCQTLVIDSGDPGRASKELARDIHILFDSNDNALPSAVAIRIDCAEVVLKPFVDAILAMYGIHVEEGVQAMETRTRDN